MARRAVVVPKLRDIDDDEADDIGVNALRAAGENARAAVQQMEKARAALVRIIVLG